MARAGLFFLSHRPFEGPFIFDCSFKACQHLSYFNAVPVSIRFDLQAHESAKLGPSAIFSHPVHLFILFLTEILQFALSAQ